MAGLTGNATGGGVEDSTALSAAKRRCTGRHRLSTETAAGTTPGTRCEPQSNVSEEEKRLCLAEVRSLSVLGVPEVCSLHTSLLCLLPRKRGCHDMGGEWLSGSHSPACQGLDPLGLLW